MRVRKVSRSKVSVRKVRAGRALVSKVSINKVGVRGFPANGVIFIPGRDGAGARWLGKKL